MKKESQPITFDKKNAKALKAAIALGVEFSRAETEYIHAAHNQLEMGIPLSVEQSVALSSIKLPER